MLHSTIRITSSSGDLRLFVTLLRLPGISWKYIWELYQATDQGNYNEADRCIAAKMESWNVDLLKNM